MTEQSTDHVTITNNSSEPIAFKVKTTAPKLYCVRPNSAIVAAGETAKVDVIFLGLPEEPSQDSKCKDKFLVLTLPAPYELNDKSVAEVWPELEAEFKQKLTSKKIKVKYAFTETPIEPVTASSQVLEEKVEPVKEVIEERVEEVKEPLKDSVKETKEEIVKETNEENVKEIAEEKVTKSKAEEPIEEVRNNDTAATTTSLNSSALILVAIIALALGWLYY